MKITSQSSHAAKTGSSSPDAGFNERCLKNQSAFTSFIDLIPSKIYLNIPEDTSTGHGSPQVSRSDPRRQRTDTDRVRIARTTRAKCKRAKART